MKMLDELFNAVCGDKYHDMVIALSEDGCGLYAYPCEYEGDNMRPVRSLGFKISDKNWVTDEMKDFDGIVISDNHESVYNGIYNIYPVIEHPDGYEAARIVLW